MLQRIKTITNEIGQQLWVNKTHLLSLSEFVPLQQVLKLRICYQAAQAHPEVIVGTRVDTITINDENGDTAAPNNDDSDADVILVETPTNTAQPKSKSSKQTPIISLTLSCFSRHHS